MKKVLINVEERELRVAILEDEQLVELYIESLDEKSILNNIYKGRVEDVLPGLKAAFVNIGLDRNAFLHFDDVRPDLLWAKYRDLNPEMADEVPTAREALAAAADVEAEGEAEQDDGKRKRRRGRRGGKKRRPDAEDTYSPGLPVGVTEDDLEDEDEEEVEATVVAEPPQPAATRTEPVAVREQPPAVEVQREQVQAVAATSPVSSTAAAEEIEARKQARLEKQKQRRERWEQKKLERQQRRQQERGERGEQTVPQQTMNVAPEQETVQPAVFGTRAAASAYDSSSSFVNPTRRQLQQNKARYGDSFGNIAVGGQRRHDNRDSQVDFFGPATPVHEEEHSVWDERQPNLGPVPGMGKAFLANFETRGNERRSPERRQGSGQQQNRNKKFTSSNKRRGGKKRSMRKRDSRSYFAFSADDIVENEQSIRDEAAALEPEAPKKTTRRKIATSTDGEEAPLKKSTTRKTASAKKTTATTRKKKPDDVHSQEAITQELPLDLPAQQDVPVVEEASAPRKPARSRKTPTTRTRKTTAKTQPEEELNLEAAEEQALQDKESATGTAESPAPKTHAVEEKTGPIAAAPGAAEVPAEPGAVVPEQEPAAEAAEAAEAAGDRQQAPQRRRSSRPSRAERAARNRAKRAEEKATAESADVPAAAGGETGVGDVSTTAVDPAELPEAAEVQQVVATTAVVPIDQGRQQQPQSQQQRRDLRRKIRRPQFQDVFKKGDEIMVQVVKEEIGMKGARISSYVSLPGRYLVLLPYPNQEGGISRKVEDIRERKRLKNLLRDISSDETAFIVRTAGVYQEEKEIHDDVEFLSHEWGTIAERFAKAEATSLVYDDHDIIYRLARDVFDDSVAEIHIDSHLEHDKLKQILEKLIPDLVDKVKLYSGAENIFHKFGVTKQIQKAARRKVWLKSGGYLIIDEAEALTAIDVNTGKSVGKDDQEKLILRTNLESARAVARELKLRDIGGLIVIDFIDMKDARNKEQVLNELKLQLRKDRSKTSVSAISEFGLVEMTRKRVRRSLRKTLFMDCPYCQGAGVVLNEQQIWLHIKHEVVRQLESTKPAPTLSITVNPRIRAYIDQNYRDVIRKLEQKYDTEVRITMSDIFHIENYQIETAETTGVISGSATMPTR